MIITNELISSICKKHHIPSIDLALSVIVLNETGFPFNDHGVNILEVLVEVMKVGIENTKEIEAKLAEIRNN